MRYFILSATLLLWFHVLLHANCSLFDSIPENHISGDSTFIASGTNNYEWFQGGNIDFISSGLLRSTANVFFLNLGDPDKFYIPFYLLIGATTDILQEDIVFNEIVVADLLNTKGGFINFGLSGESRLKSLGQHTEWFLSYQCGAKSITGTNIEANKNESFLSLIGNVGMLLKTAAWSSDNPGKKGNAWFKYYLSFSKNNPEKMKALFGPCSDAYLSAANIEGGIDLENIVKISFGYYQYLNNTHLELFDDGFFKFTADFILGK